MKPLFYLFVFCLPLGLLAQTGTESTTTADTGLHFQHGLTWQQVKEKAQKENKYIFMDCFTTWCGPCRYMSKNIFPLPEVGNAMNPNFVAVKMQLDTSDADNEEVKKMYTAAHQIAEEYKVNVYPTYLFFSPDGQLVHRAVGSSEADKFLKKTEEALHPETQYYTQLAKFKAGKKDSAFLHTLVDQAMNAYDMDNAAEITSDYLATQPDVYTKENLSLLKNSVRKSSDKGFDVFLKNGDKVDAVLGKGTADAFVQNIALREDLYPKLRAQKAKTATELQEPNWTELDASFKQKYPGKEEMLSAYAKAMFFLNKQDWAKFVPAISAYMKSYGDNLDEQQLNTFSWAVFQNCSDEACLQQALAWSRRSFEGEPNPEYMDTYANILYRLGKKEEAIAWEQKAVNMVPEESKKTYQETIDKMKAGEKTWN